MSILKFSNLFAEATNFNKEISFDESKLSYKEKYNLNCLADGTMTLNRMRKYFSENNDFWVEKHADKFYRGSYEIISDEEKERVIRLNVEFLIDRSNDSKSTQEKPFTQTIHFFTEKTENQFSTFTYLRNEIFENFIESFSQQNDKLFHALELAGETDELKNRNIIKKYGNNILEYFEERFPDYKIKQG